MTETHAITGKFSRSQASQAPALLEAVRFGYGGADPKTGQSRSFPKPLDYAEFVGSALVSGEDGKQEPRLKGDALEAVYRRVFRDTLQGPGFALLSGFPRWMHDDLEKFRRFLVNVAGQLVQRRRQDLDLPEKETFSFKYLGRSQKLKSNPPHSDSRSTDSIAIMGYEPAVNVEARPFMADISQMAEDLGVSVESLMRPGAAMKSHYGNQLDKEHHARLLAEYARDVEALDPKQLQVILLNDSVGKGNRALLHGVRSEALRITGENPSRFFDHLVLDVPARNYPGEMSRETARMIADPRYYEKCATPPEKQSALAPIEAVRKFIKEGKIFYRIQ